MDKTQREMASVVTAHHEWVKRETARRLRREMTTAERLLWRHLRGSRLNGVHFHRQQIIDGFIADFYCHAAQVVIEVDGAIHNDQQDYDAERARIFLQRGLLTLRFTNTEVETSPYTVTACIRQAVGPRL